MGFPGSSAGKESTYNSGDPVQFLGREDLLEKGQSTTPVFWPGKSPGQRSLKGYSPWGHKESDTTKCLTTQHSILTLDFIKIESLCPLNGMVETMKKRTADQEKHWTCLKNIKCLEFNHKKSNSSIFFNGQKISNAFTKEDIQMANKHMKVFSTSLVTGKMQIKSTMS